MHDFLQSIIVRFATKNMNITCDLRSFSLQKTSVYQPKQMWRDLDLDLEVSIICENKNCEYVYLSNQFDDKQMYQKHSSFIKIYTGNIY